MEMRNRKVEIIKLIFASLHRNVFHRNGVLVNLSRDSVSWLLILSFRVWKLKTNPERGTIFYFGD